MNFNKRIFLFSLFFILISQIFLYSNNRQKTTFRYFKWTVQEVSIGKLISISFFSGLFISTFLNTKIPNIKKSSFESIEENYEPINYEEDNKPNIDMPPQRDIRDSQPTISVNYRVVKNTKENELNSEQNYSNNINDKEDWYKNENDW